MFHQAKTTRSSGGRVLRLAAALMLGSAMGAVAATPAHAQESQASLRGTISGGATQVTAVEVATGVRRSSTVEPDGSYNFPALRPGEYRLEVTVDGRTRTTDTFTLSVAQDAQLDFDVAAVSPGAAPAEPPPEDDTGAVQTSNIPQGQDIIVTGNRIRTLEGGEVGINISQRLIEQLPQNSRNFLAFADLAPGVRFVEEGTSGQARIQGGAQDSRTVNVFIDGVSQKDYVLKNGITGQDSTPGNPFPQLAIGEYRVLSSNYKAEFDQVASVAITAITKSGTNEFHGEGFIDYTDETLRDARPTELFNNTGKVQTKDMQFGGALGGPIIRDVMHFFVSYEGKRREIPVDIFPGGGLQPSALPAEYQDIFGATNQTFNEDLYFGKIDIVPTDSDLFEFTVKYRDESGISLGSGIAAESTAVNTKVDELRGLARWQHTQDTWVNDLRVSYEDVSWSPQPSVFEPGRLFQLTTQGANGSIARTDLFRIGGSQNFQDKGQKGWTVQDDFTYTGFDGHTIKTGVKAKWVELNTTQQNFFNPLYTYNASLFPGTFNDDIPYRVQFGAPGASGTSEVTSDNFQFGIYVQDDWDVTDRLTLNIGIRWDYERTPAYLDYVTTPEALAAVSPATYPNLVNANYDINNYITDGDDRKAFTGAFQPRLGFSYAFDDDRRFVLFGGYGRSYDRNQFDFLQQEIAQGAFPVRTFNFITNDPLNPCTPSATCVPFDPIYLTPEGRAQLAQGAVGGGRELRYITNDLDVPYSDQFSLGIRTRFDPIELEFGYTHIESKDGFVFLLGNRRPDGSFFFNDPANPNDVPNSPFGFTPPGFGSIIIGDNGLETSSDAAYVKLTKRYTAASPWSLDATYTYTEAEENRQFGETFSLDFPSIEDYPVLRSSGVPRHRFVTAGSVDTPIGVTLSAKFQIESPAFQKAFINTANPFERTIVGIEREGNGDRWGRRQLDVAFTKYVPLGFITDETQLRFRVDIINLMNDRNYVDFNNNPTDNTRTSASPTVFGERTGFGVGGNPPRTIKLSAGFSF